jgi:CRP-like cAMP-binding protein
MENAVWGYIFGPPKEKKAMIDMLRALPAFEGLSSNELVQIERMLHQRRYSAGEAVFEEGMPGAGMYIVKEGEVAIRKRVDDNHAIELAAIGSQNFFGELALLDETPRSASAYASRESVLLALSGPDLEKIRDRNPKLALKVIGNVARLVCKRLVRTNEHLESVQKKLNECSQKAAQTSEAVEHAVR